jgi:hypothetical protein
MSIATSKEEKIPHKEKTSPGEEFFIDQTPTARKREIQV